MQIYILCFICLSKKYLLYLKVYRECVSLQQPLDGKNTAFPSCLCTELYFKFILIKLIINQGVTEETHASRNCCSPCIRWVIWVSLLRLKKGFQGGSLGNSLQKQKTLQRKGYITFISLTIKFIQPRLHLVLRHRFDRLDQSRGNYKREKATFSKDSALNF